jgi:peptide/nickel transport system permease protein
MGVSLYTGRPVLQTIGETLPVTLQLIAGALVIAVLVAVPLGVLGAVNRGGWTDRITRIVAPAAMAAPPFAVGLLLVTFFAVRLRWLPSGGYVPASKDLFGWGLALLLPAVALAVDPAAELVRQTRGAMVEVLDRDYMQTAVAMGIPRRTVVTKYALKNAGIPIVTVFGLQAARVFGAAVVMELIFTLPGFGSEALTAVLFHDYPMIQGIIIVSGLLTILVNTAVDASYAYFDPRLR